MKKIIPLLIFSCILTGCTFANSSSGIFEGIKQDFTTASDKIQSDLKGLNPPKQMGLGEEMTLQELMNYIKEEKSKEMVVVDRQIEYKEAQIRSVYLNPKLSLSQKKAQAALLKNEIETLKIQKENINEKYRQKVRDFRN